MSTNKNQKIKKLVNKRVNEVIRDLFNDPDYGAELKPQFIKRLKKSQKSKKRRKSKNSGKNFEKI